MNQLQRIISAGILMCLVTMFFAVSAGADFTDTSELTDAMDLDAGEIVEVVFNGFNGAASVETIPMAGFPTAGTSYLVLSTGTATHFTNINDNPATTTIFEPYCSGLCDRTQLQIRLDPPETATCFAFDFRFFSEEYPEHFIFANDTFTAEIIDTDLTYINNTIVTPYNFAYDSDGNPISVNTTEMTDSTETTYDGWTSLLAAITPVELSDDQNVLITLTIQDLNDPFVDTAVAIDNARWLYGPNCEFGAPVLIDTDGDRLPDVWETDGLDVDGDMIIDLDLPAMGADPEHKDLFLEIDWMFDLGDCVVEYCTGDDTIPDAACIPRGCTDIKNFKPSEAALEAVIQAFADAPVDNPDGESGINLHIDAGPLSVMDATTGDRWGNLGRGSAVDHVEELGNFVAGTFSAVACDGSTINYNEAYSWEAFDDIKNSNFDDARRDVFHYALYADTFAGRRSSGIARGIPSADFLVTQGLFHGGTGFENVEEQGTLMHELGHNLGLRHGGDTNCNRQPNYLSIMNYEFQLTGLLKDATYGTLDYSRAELDSLNENSLDETVGLGPDSDVGTFGTHWYSPTEYWFTDDAAGPIDWDGNTVIDVAPVAVNINDDAYMTTLEGHNDWANLRYDGGAIGMFGVQDSPQLTVVDEPTIEDFEKRGHLSGPYQFILTTNAAELLLPGTDERSIFFNILNTGEMTDTYEIQISGDLVFSIPEDPMVHSGESGSFAAMIDTDALVPGRYLMTITATSVGDPGVFDKRTTLVIVPDLTDSYVQTELEQLQETLNSLSPEDLLDPELYQWFDMVEETMRPDPRVALQEVRDALAELESSDAIDKSIRSLDRALDEKRWIDDDELALNGGSSVFAQLQQVLRDVEDADIAPEDSDDVIVAIDGAAEDLLDRKYELAVVAGVSADVLNVVAPMIDSAEAIAESGDLRAAMITYQEAWDLLNESLN
jgi:hypothetical protein